MSLGLTLILVLFVLEVLGYFKTLAGMLKMHRVSLCVFFGALTASYIVPPACTGGTKIYWMPYIILTAYSVYLLSGLTEPPKALGSALIASCVLRAVSLVVPVQPSGIIYEPYALYTVASAVLNMFTAKNESEAVFNPLFSFLIFAALLLFSASTTEFFPQKALSGIVISSFAGMLPPMLSRKKREDKTVCVVKTHRISSSNKKNLEK